MTTNIIFDYCKYQPWSIKTQALLGKFGFCLLNSGDLWGVGRSYFHSAGENKALYVLSLSFVARKKYYVLENVDFYFF